jgi:hypothetical protein
LIASYGYAQEMRLPDDKKKKYVKEEKVQPEKPAEPTTGRTIPTESRERVKEDGNKPDSKVVNYCIVRETLYEGGKAVIDIESDMSSLENNREVNPAEYKYLIEVTQNQKYKTALMAMNQLAQKGYRLSSTSVYQGEKGLVKEYIMKSGD